MFNRFQKVIIEGMVDHSIDNATWVMAFGSIMSVGVIAYQARFMRVQTRILKDQSNKTNELIEIEQKRDLQAYKISGWLSISKDGSDMGFSSGGIPSKANVYNASNQPIYEVTGTIWNTATTYESGLHRQVQTFDLGTIPPGDRVNFQLDRDYRQEQTAVYRGIYGDHAAAFSAWMMKPIEISFKFRDSEEIWWERTIDCRMKRLSLPQSSYSAYLKARSINRWRKIWRFRLIKKPQ